MKPTDPRQVPADHAHDPEFLHNEGVAHEHSDINIRGILVFCVGLTVIAIVVHLLMYGLFYFFDAHAKANDPQLSPLAPPAVQMPRTTTADPKFGNALGPRLLTNEYRVLDEHRRNEEQQTRNEEAAKHRAPRKRRKRQSAGEGARECGRHPE